MKLYTVKGFIPRNSTCKIMRFRILIDGKPTTTEFGRFEDANRYAALRELRGFAEDKGIAIDMTDSELLAKLRVLFTRAEKERGAA